MPIARLFSAMLVLLVGVLATASAEPAPQAKVRIALAGDSTVTDNAGWGLGFAKSLGDRFEVINISRGGRASGSFYAEGRWKQILDQKPDYVMIQFGHNDQPGHGPDRETDPNTTYRANMTRYVDEALAAGIKPILVTSISRREWDKDRYTIHSSLAPYAAVVREIAAQKHIPLIDLHNRSIEIYEALGPKGCELISPHKDNGDFDGTHLNVVGSELFGPLMAWELRGAVPELASLVRGGIPMESRLSTTQPTAAPTTGPAAELLSAKAQPATSKGSKTIVVATDGTGDFKRVQDAIAAVDANNADRTTIRIKAGVYSGPFVVPASRQNVSFVGDGADKTILSFPLNVYDPVPPGVPSKMGGNGTIVLGEGFHASDLTFRNTSGDHGQAMALRLQADKCVIERCQLLGWQDTLLAYSKRLYFRDSYIEGRVDFIYGGATAVFDHCELHSKNGGFVTAASTPQDREFGYVFLDCKLTSDDSTPVFLGRPWRPYAAVTYLRCEMGAHIAPEGWNNWGKTDNEKTARYAEFASTGSGGDMSRRAGWAHTLTPSEAEALSPQHILAGADGWDPTTK